MGCANLNFYQLYIVFILFLLININRRTTKSCRNGAKWCLNQRCNSVENQISVFVFTEAGHYVLQALSLSDHLALKILDLILVTNNSYFNYCVMTCFTLCSDHLLNVKATLGPVQKICTDDWVTHRKPI